MIKENAKKNGRSCHVSVVIPAYNAEKYIGRAIDSVLRQSRRPDEIIVVNDGSTDNTEQVVKQFGSQVRYIHQQNAGASVARNTAISAANCQWIAFLDADDEWLEEHLESQMSLLEKNAELVWAGANFYRCHGDGQLVADTEPAKAAELLGDKQYFDNFFTTYRKVVFWTGTAIISREVLNEIGLFRREIQMCEDVDMWFRIANHYPTIGYNTKPLAVYYLDIPGSQIKTRRKHQFICDSIEYLLKYSDKHGHLEEFTLCARGILSNWMAQTLRIRQGSEVRAVLKQFGFLFSRYYIVTTYIKSLFPRTGMCYDRWKKKLIK